MKLKLYKKPSFNFKFIINLFQAENISILKYSILQTLREDPSDELFLDYNIDRKLFDVEDSHN